MRGEASLYVVVLYTPADSGTKVIGWEGNRQVHLTPFIIHAAAMVLSCECAELRPPIMGAVYMQ